MKRATRNWLMVLGGIALAVGGFVLLKFVDTSAGVLLPLPYVMIGLGCGLFGGGLGELMQHWSVKNHPEIQKQLEIDQRDERNTAIANQAKAKAYDAMVFIFGALMVSFALMGVDFAAVLMLVCAYLFVVGVGCYYRLRYEKEM